MRYRYGLLCLTLLLTGPSALADKLGIIGDSLSTAMSANDACDDIDACLLQIREDREFSFAGGLQPWSLRNRLAASGVDGVVDASRNGARWDDALGQAQQIVADPDVSYVSIELGGNDVCRGVGEALPDINQIVGHVDQTLTLLSDRLASGSTVLLAAAPDVVQLYELLRARPNFLFQNCQALWDVDASGLSDDAVRALCNNVLSDAICDSPLGLASARPLVAALFEETFVDRFGSEFPCGKVLNSASSAADRAAAADFNQRLNTLLADKADQYRDRNGVKVLFAGGVFEQRFAADEVSALDCFHPSRAGQQRLADAIWRDVEGALSADLFSNGFENQ